MNYKTNVMAALTGLLMSSGQAFSASSVDSSLDELASQIVERTSTEERPTIGISTFTHSDGTCTQLSNYVTEFIVDSLFNAGNGKIDIIERSQLSAIFREMELVFDGTIAPDTAKKLGEIEGVDAVVTGSLIEFGEVVKIQSRLIGTSDGRLFATARSEFPSVGSVAKMMANRSRAQCGFTDKTGAQQVTATQETPAAPRQTQSGDASGSIADSSRLFQSDVFDAQISTLVYSKSKGDYSFGIRFKNTADTTIVLSHFPGTLTVSDGQGGMLTYKSGSWSGIRTCYSENRLDLCNGSDPRYGTIIAPGKIAQLNFAMTGEKGIEAPQLSIGLEQIVTPDYSDKDAYGVQSIGFYDLQPTVK